MFFRAFCYLIVKRYTGITVCHLCSSLIMRLRLFQLPRSYFVLTYHVAVARPTSVRPRRSRAPLPTASLLLLSRVTHHVAVARPTTWLPAWPPVSRTLSAAAPHSVPAVWSIAVLARFAPPLSASRRPRAPLPTA